MKLNFIQTDQEGRANCSNCTLRNSALCANLAEQDLERIHQSIDVYSLLPGSLLYRAGDLGDRLYTVRSGTLKLVQYLPDGTQRIVRLLGATDVAGLEALLGKPYQHDAVVVHSTETCSLPVDMMQTLSQNNTALYQELLSRWQQSLKEADAWLTEFSTGSARQRIARLLLRLSQNKTNRECTLFTREDMGAMLGITTETVSRNIAEFKRRSLLVETGGNHFMLDTDNLERVIEQASH